MIVNGLILKGELQRRIKLISFETPFKIMQNETKIIKIRQAVLKIFIFKVKICTVFMEKKKTISKGKPKISFTGFAQAEEP